MATPKDNKLKYATRLAHNCIKSSYSEDIEAFLGMDMEIDWKMRVDDSHSLAELAFLRISDSLHLRKCWKQMSKTLGVSHWDTTTTFSDLKDMSFVGWALMHDNTSIVSGWMSADKGRKNNWDLLLSNKKIKEFALTDQWLEIENSFKELGLDEDFVSELSKYRQDNLWLRSSDPKSLFNNSPKSWSGSDSLSWYKICLENISNKGYKESKSIILKKPWMLEKFIIQKEGWSSWSDDIWREFLDITPPGFINNIVRQSSSSSKVKEFESCFNEFIHRLYQSMSINDIKKEMIPLVLDIYEHQSNPIFRYTSSIANSLLVLKNSSKWLKKSISSLPSSSDSDNNTKGLMLAFIDTAIFKKSSLSKDALDILIDKKFALPSQYLDLSSLILPAKASFLSPDERDLFSSAIAMGACHVIKAYEQRQDLEGMSKFVDSIELPLTEKDNNFISKKEDEIIGTELAKWSQREGSKSICDDSSREWAHIFWRSIFSMQTANQHYWLKKTASDKNLQICLRFWNDEFGEFIEKTIETRKRTPEIHSLLSKMSILNATNQVSLIETKSSRRQSKI